MEVTLVIVTLVSIALAMAMGVITWRLLHEEHLRADARVTALEEGLADSLATNPVPTRDDDTDWLEQFPSSGARTSPLRMDGESSPNVRTAPIQTAPIQTAPIQAASTETAMSSNGGLFGAGESSSSSSDETGPSRRAVAIAAVAAVAIGAMLTVWTIGRVMAPSSTGAAATAASAAAAPATIELVSLRHTQQPDGTLTITGLVRNPHGGTPQERLAAVVFFFDSQGGFLSSTRAPLDFRALAPGDESPFHLSAQAPAGVARYRVSFRREEGAIVPHIDRRPQEASRS